MSTDRPRRKLRHTLDALRLRLPRAKALPQLATLGLICGLLTGIVIIAFRMLIEVSQSLFLPGAGPENYEGLAMTWRFLLPLAGGLVLGLIFQAGHSVGREGPAIHLGAASGSLAGRYLGLPNNGLRVLDEQDRMRPHMRFFVNGDQVFNITQPLRPTDSVIRVQALSGG